MPDQPATEGQLDQAEARLGQRITAVDQRLTETEARLDQRITAVDQRITETEARLLDQMRAMEKRLLHQIADAASRVTNVVVEQLGDLLRPADEKATQATGDARRSLSQAEQLRRDFDAHAADPDAHTKK